MRLIPLLLSVTLGMAQAQPAPATQKLLQAVLAHPRVQPKSADKPKPPAGLKSGEAGLIAYLEAQQRQGGDVNAYASLGTPLQHAVQARLTLLALWLLAHGADPLLPIQAEGTQNAPLPDTLGLAVQQSLAALLQHLQQHPKVQALPPTELAQRIWTHSQPKQQALLLQGGWPLPSAQTQPELFRRLFRQFMCSTQLAPLKSMAAQAGAAEALRPLQAETWDCPRLFPQFSAPNWAAELDDWRAVEQALGQPVLARLSPRAADAATLTQWLTLGLAKPWSEPKASARWLEALHAAPQPVQLAAARAIPPEALRAALAQPEGLQAWLRLAARWPLADTRSALAAVQPDILGAHLDAALAHWGPTGSEAEARWALLNERLPSRLTRRATEWLDYVPLAHWGAWLKRGFQPAPIWWAQWLRQTSNPAQLQQAWPVVKAQRPEVAAAWMDWLLAPWAVGPGGDAQTQADSYPNGLGRMDGALERLQGLKALGARPTAPRWVAAAHEEDEEPAVQLALKEGWLRKAPAADPPTIRKPSCPALLKPARSLLAELQQADELQTVDLGSGRCALLALAGQGTGRREFESRSFEAGLERFQPLADGDRRAWLWEPGQTALKPLESAPLGPLLPVQWQGQALWLELEWEGSATREPGKLWQGGAPGKTADFMPLPKQHPLTQALALQCDFQALSTCLGLSETDALQPPSREDYLRRALAETPTPKKR